MNAHADVEPHNEDHPRFGFTNAELAEHPTVYRNDLLDGQTVIISGGGTGMGKAMAFLASRLGANVVLCGRTVEKLAATQDAIERLVGRRPMAVPMSIREPDQVEQMLDQVLDRFGRIDTLINNAGGQFPQDAIDFSRKGWLAVMDLNLNGTWWMMQEAAKRWVAAGTAGNIINIVATVERGMPQSAHCCAARAGVIYLSKTLSTEWAPHHIRVNCVAPGIVETEGFAVYPDEALARFHLANPMQKRGDAWDVAEAVVYLAAPSGKFITGEVINVDGGQNQWGVNWPAGIPDYFNISGAA
ncbi:SDR family oxidoreductase [Sphingomonas sp. RT2P30]|uniref:SDR family oxidoreductase n=1 Tax=Parasphingomonas halimpatiens TaxID=3096162 RepID=UPI002FCAD211